MEIKVRPPDTQYLLVYVTYDSSVAGWQPVHPKLRMHTMHTTYRHARRLSEDTPVRYSPNSYRKRVVEIRKLVIVVSTRAVWTRPLDVRMFLDIIDHALQDKHSFRSVKDQWRKVFSTKTIRPAWGRLVRSPNQKTRWGVDRIQLASVVEPFIR